MGVIQSALHWMGLRAEAPAAGMSIDQLAQQLQGGGLSTAGEMVTTNTAESLAAVGACVRLLAKSVAKTPIMLYTRDRDGRKVKAETDPLWTLLHDQPNDWQTAFQFKHMMERDYDLRGNAYAQIVRGLGDRPVALMRMHPDTCWPELKRDATIVFNRRLPSGKIIELPFKDVLHLWDWSDDGLKGISPVQAYRDVLGKGLAERRHGAKFFQRGAKTSGVLKAMDGKTIGSEAAAALREDFSKLYAGTDNAYETVVLPAGLDYTPISINMQDSQFIESQKMTGYDIAMIFGVPPHKIGMLDRATFNNIEHQSIEFVHDGLEPRTTMWEQALNMKLLAPNDRRFFKFDIDRNLHGDMKTRALTHNIYRRAGVMNANEIREDLGMNRREDDGGDDYIVESNMALNDGTDPSAPPNSRED